MFCFIWIDVCQISSILLIDSSILDQFMLLVRAEPEVNELVISYSHFTV